MMQLARCTEQTQGSIPGFFHFDSVLDLEYFGLEFVDILVEPFSATHKHKAVGLIAAEHDIAENIVVNYVPDLGGKDGEEQIGQR
jgi:hypothetical protein